MYRDDHEVDNTSVRESNSQIRTKAFFFLKGIEAIFKGLLKILFFLPKLLVYGALAFVICPFRILRALGGERVPSFLMAFFLDTFDPESPIDTDLRTDDPGTILLEFLFWILCPLLFAIPFLPSSESQDSDPSDRCISQERDTHVRQRTGETHREEDSFLETVQPTSQGQKEASP